MYHSVHLQGLFNWCGWVRGLIQHPLKSMDLSTDFTGHWIRSQWSDPLLYHWSRLISFCVSSAQNMAEGRHFMLASYTAYWQMWATLWQGNSPLASLQQILLPCIAWAALNGCNRGENVMLNLQETPFKWRNIERGYWAWSLWKVNVPWSRTDMQENNQIFWICIETDCT